VVERTKESEKIRLRLCAGEAEWEILLENVIPACRMFLFARLAVS
jgi:hypothetical protein